MYRKVFFVVVMATTLLIILVYLFSSKHIIVSSKSEWWKTMSLYHIYPRSFKDSNGDGIGDLKGIQSKLQYLVDSKFNAFWITPIYKSPLIDFGYDISDFNSIDPDYGTMEDFESLIKKAHDLGLKLIMDFVPNHSSNEHEWFEKSLKKIDPYTDYYIWHEGKIVNGTRKPPNNWNSAFYGSAWSFSEERQAYYLHQFSWGQPDLNFRNAHVVEEMKNALRFWLDKGVDGFRVDAIPHLFEIEDFRDEPLTGTTEDPLSYDYTEHDYTKSLDENYDMVRQWRKVLDEYDSRIMMAEAYANLSRTMDYYEAGATFPFNFGLIALLEKNDRLKNFGFSLSLSNDSTAENLKEMVDDWMSNMPKGAVANWVAGNHDLARLVSSFGQDFAPAVTIMVQLLPGVSVTYNGEEIGMENTFLSYEDTRDPQGRDAGPIGYLARSRDPQRTPFQWDNTTSAGFSTNSKTWLPVNQNYKTLNLEAQKADNNSYYKSFLKVTSLREWGAVKSGSLQTELLNQNVFAFARDLKNERSVYVVANPSNEAQIVSLKAFKSAPTQVELYHTTSDAGSPVGAKVKSDTLRIPSRGAAIFVSL